MERGAPQHGSAAAPIATTSVHLPEGAPRPDTLGVTSVEPSPVVRRVVIADDEPQLRDVLELALGSRPHLEVVAIECTGEDAVAAVARLQPDVVVLDLAMPGRGGRWAAAEILRDHPGTDVVVLSAQASRSVTRELLALGVRAVLAKGAPIDELYRAVDGPSSAPSC